jgi:AraC family transcriptional regulator
MPDFQFHHNPPWSRLPHCSAIVSGAGGDYRVDQYRTTLSVKTVVRGSAYYSTLQGRYRVTEDSILILNHDQEYSLRIKGELPTETLCPFFQPGFLEHVASCLAVPGERQLDDIEVHTPPVEFCERLYPKRGAVARALAGIHVGLRTPGASGPRLEDGFYGLAAALVELQTGVRREMDKFPGMRAATRAELYRRLHVGRDFLSSCYSEPVRVATVARAAHLSPYHFQRMFKLAFHQTPMQFLQETRLEAARRLLLTTQQDITSICFAVGFESLGSFSWLFRKRFGCSPKQFRSHGRGTETPQD